MLRKVFNIEIKGIDENEKTLTATISTNAIDRMGEVLLPEGADLKEFKKNPVVLWAHQYDAPPIGQALWVKKSIDGIISKVKFASTTFAQEIFQLYKEGVMRAFSVGFLPDMNAIEEGDKCNDGGKKPRRTYKKWELLEYSAVPVPANPEALALAMQKGLLKNEDVKTWLEKGWQEEIIINDEDKCDKVKIIEPVKDASKSQVQAKPLDDIVAENNQLKETISSLNKEVGELKYKIYSMANQPKQSDAKVEITDSEILRKVEEIAVGVISKAKGKIE